MELWSNPCFQIREKGFLFLGFKIGSINMIEKEEIIMLRKLAVVLIILAFVCLALGVGIKLLIYSDLIIFRLFSPAGFGQGAAICSLLAISLLLLDKKSSWDCGKDWGQIFTAVAPTISLWVSIESVLSHNSRPVTFPVRNIRIIALRKCYARPVKVQRKISNGKCLSRWQVLSLHFTSLRFIQNPFGITKRMFGQ